MKSLGVDVVLNSKNINRRFKWFTTLLYNFNRSKTTKYDDARALRISSLIGSGRNISPVIGKPLYAMVAYRWGGLDAAGNPQGYLNGQLSTNYSAILSEAVAKGLQDGNLFFVGSAAPVSFGSLINTFSYKQLEISFNITYKFGYYFGKPVINYGSLVNNGSGNNEYSNRWQKPGDEQFTTVPSFVYPVNSARDGFYSAAEINVLKAGHIRLRYINLSYTLQKNHPKFPVDQLQVYFNASNLGILWRANKHGLDPENTSGIPVSIQLATGIRIHF
jgi:hypothetical protein